MASVDLKNNIKQANAFNIQAIASDTTTAGNEIDLAGYESVTLVLQAGAVTAGDATLLIQESDTSGGTFTDVADTDLIGLEADTKVDAANATTRIGVLSKKQYIKASVVTANSANLTVGAIAILGSARHNPVD
jgi:hypothetical protein